jgi:hypothetical protein
VYFDYTATRTGGFADYFFDQFAFEVPLGLDDDGEIIKVAKKVVWDGLASGKSSTTTFWSRSTWIVRLSALLWHMMGSRTRAMPRVIAVEDYCCTVLVVSSSRIKCC